MGGGLLRGVLICAPLIRGVSPRPADAPIMPRRERTRRVAEQPSEEVADIGIDARVTEKNGVIGVPCFLPPSVEDRLLERVVRVNGGDDALGGVVEQDAADADLPVE